MYAKRKIATDLHSASIRLLRWLRREDAAGALPPAQLSALSVVVHAPGITATDLAREEQVRAPTMTRTVDALVAAGMVDRANDPNDRRRVIIAPTEKGRSHLDKAAARRIGRLMERLEDLSQEELATLKAASLLIRRITGAPDA